MRRALALALASLATPAAAQVMHGSGAAAPGNDYPTEARAEFVFACMATNGQTRKALSECSCAIDHIATLLTYDDYVAAETVLAMRQTSGERTAVFRDTVTASDIAKRLRAAEAEAEILCFRPGS